MTYWLVMMTEENYRHTLEKRIYGLPAKLSRIKDLIKPGDKLVVYVMKKGCSELCSSFTAVLRVAGDWRMSTRPFWPDEVREGKVKYPWVVDVEAVAVGKVEFGSVKGEISRLLSRNISSPDKLRIYMWGRNGLPSVVGELIEERLKSTPIAGGEKAGLSHDELVEMVEDIGRWLGFEVATNYSIDNFRVDVAFFKRPKKGPYAVTEIHVGGDVYKDLAALKHARDTYESKLIYVIARDESKVLSLVNEALEGAFHEIKDELILLKAEELVQLHEVLKKENARRLLKELTKK